MPLGFITLIGIIAISALAGFLLILLRRHLTSPTAQTSELEEEDKHHAEFYTPIMPKVLPVLCLTLISAALILIWSIAISYAGQSSNNKPLLHHLFLVALPLFGSPLLGLFYAYKKGVFYEQ